LIPNRKERRSAAARKRQQEKKDRRLLREAKQYHYAFADGISTLYKFKAFSTPFDEEVIREILVDHTIYFARADQLNDDQEMKIRHEIDGDPHDPKVRKRVIKRTEQLMRSHTPPLSKDEIAAHLDYLATADFDLLVADATARSREDLIRNFPIFSMAIRNTEPLHWEEYADHWTGLCVHFNSAAKVSSPFAYARKVEYAAERLPIPVPLNIGPTELARRVGLTKPLKYSGEIEYRLVVCQGYEACITITGQKGLFDWRHITGVTVGEKMPSVQLEKVKRLVSVRSPAIPLFVASSTAAGTQISLLRQ
jgi:hypothetical protein